jgi:hypothetical protein
VSQPLSPLERTLVELVAAEHWPGFRVERLQVVRREDTGVGRYVYFEDLDAQPLTDGTYAAEGRIVEMQGIRNGLFFVIEVSSSRINYLELVTCGSDTWDGMERDWRVV